MTSDIGKTREVNSNDTVLVSFGDVTVRMVKPTESSIRANIKAGQAALQRGKTAIIKVGVKIPRVKGIPLYFGSEDRVGWMVRELDGQKTMGRFVSGRFRPEKPDSSLSSKKRRNKA